MVLKGSLAVTTLLKVEATHVLIINRDRNIAKKDFGGQFSPITPSLTCTFSITSIQRSDCSRRYMLSKAAGSAENWC